MSYAPPQSEKSATAAHSTANQPATGRVAKATETPILTSTGTSRPRRIITTIGAK